MVPGTRSRYLEVLQLIDVDCLKIRCCFQGNYGSLGHQLAKFLCGVRFTNGLSGLDGLENAVLNPDARKAVEMSVSVPC